MRALPICAFSISVAVGLGSFACSGSEPPGVSFGMGGTVSSAAGTGTTAAGTGTTPTAGTGSGATSSTGAEPSTGGSGVLPSGGTGSGGTGSAPTGGSSDTGGAAPTAGTASGGSGGGTTTGKGHFKMLVYEETRGFAHGSIKDGTEMIQAMGMANDFEVVVSDGEQDKIKNDPQLTAADLASFDMVFFMNTTGDIFSMAERDVFKTWLKDKKSFAGVHAATDTEHNYPWYEDLVGEIYSGHTMNPPTPSGTVNIEAAMKNHPTMLGLPSPWTRNEEWYKFTKGRVNGTLPGLQVLLRFGGPKQSDGPDTGQPVSWIRCWEGIRSFYTAMGHDSSAYKEADFKKHVLQGVLWAARRTSATPETCP